MTAKRKPVDKRIVAHKAAATKVRARTSELERFVRRLVNDDFDTVLDPDVHAGILAEARRALAGA